jgi:WbqC-like protein
MRTLAAHQTQYVPYPGFFEKFYSADVFVYQDDVQYVKQQVHNRNRIRTPEGWRWLTIPVRVPHTTSTIAAVTPADGKWAKQHINTIKMFYGKSPYKNRLDGLFEIMETHKGDTLSVIGLETSQYLARVIGGAAYAGVETVLESELGLTEQETQTPNDRLLALCKRLGCDRYLSGSGGRNYMDLAAWEKAGIEVVWQDYHMKPYTQVYPGWEENMSAVDLIANVEQPLVYLKS